MTLGVEGEDAGQRVTAWPLQLATCWCYHTGTQYQCKQHVDIFNHCRGSNMSVSSHPIMEKKTSTGSSPRTYAIAQRHRGALTPGGNFVVFFSFPLCHPSHDGPVTAMVTPFVCLYFCYGHPQLYSGVMALNTLDTITVLLSPYSLLQYVMDTIHIASS